MSEMKTLTVNGKAYALVDTLAREQLGTLAAAVNASAPAIVCNASGSGFAVSDSADRPLQSLRIFGKTVQGEDPSPDAPQALVSVGDGGSVGLTLAGKNLLPFPYSSGDMVSNFGIAITCNADGGITLVGTATGAMYYWLKKDFTEATLPAGNYYLSATGLSNMSIQIETRKNGAYVKTIRVGAGAFTVDYSTYDTLRVFLVCNSGKTVNETIYPQIELGKAATTYEPYKAQTFAVSTPNGLPGIPVASGGNYTDEHGQMWICDEMDYGRGVYVQRVQTQEIKSNAWAMVGTVDEGNWRFGLNVGTKPVNGAVISERFPKMSSVADGHANGGGIYIWENGYLEVVSPSHTAAEEFREWGWNNPIVVMYALATPIETPLDADTLAAFDALHTYKPATTVLNGAGAHMEISYVADTKAYIDRRLGL